MTDLIHIGNLLHLFELGFDNLQFLCERYAVFELVLFGSLVYLTNEILLLLL